MYIKFCVSYSLGMGQGSGVLASSVMKGMVFKRAVEGEAVCRLA